MSISYVDLDAQFTSVSYRTPGSQIGELHLPANTYALTLGGDDSQINLVGTLDQLRQLSEGVTKTVDNAVTWAAAEAQAECLHSDVYEDGRDTDGSQIWVCRLCGDRYNDGVTDSPEAIAHRAAQLPPQVQQIKDAGGDYWTTAEMRELFTVESFAGGYVVVRRKSDGQLGSLAFSHSPRFYYEWRADS